MELEVSLDHGLLRLTGRQVDISLSSILSFSTHPINLSLFPVSLNTLGMNRCVVETFSTLLPSLSGINTSILGIPKVPTIDGTLFPGTLSFPTLLNIN